MPPQDQLWGGAGRLQFEQQTNFHVDPVAILGTAQVSQWKSDFARATLTAWDQQNDVWIAKRFLSSAPRAEWNWTEGEDTRITWAEMFDFFLRFETNTQVGGDDGFVRLSPSENNKRLLKDATDASQAQTHALPRGGTDLIQATGPDARNGYFDLDEVSTTSR